ncbi:MAG: hypothetical protein M1816_003028 [Peltula sp. TS41687]|nr:MAG: hypothetical protein M1816_003028 [Peltula sp. TS41687]
MVTPDKRAFRMTANVKPSIESRQLLESQLAMKARAARREEACAQRRPEYWAAGGAIVLVVRDRYNAPEGPGECAVEARVEPVPRRILDYQ